MPARKQHDPTRFHQSYIKRPDGCWIWNKARSDKGYGLFKVDGKMVRAHRWAYTQFVCDPGDLMVLHKCHNVGCVNYEEHLYHGTGVQNQEDYLKHSGKYIDPAVVLEYSKLGYSQNEIARLLGCGQSRVFYLLVRARKASKTVADNQPTREML